MIGVKLELISLIQFVVPVLTSTEYNSFLLFEKKILSPSYTNLEILKL